MDTYYIEKLELIIQEYNQDGIQLRKRIKELIENYKSEKISITSHELTELLPDLMIYKDTIEGEHEDYIKTGITTIDGYIPGFPRGGLVIIGGRPGMGKTFMLSQLAYHMSKKHQSLFVSLEHSANFMCAKFLSYTSQISSTKIRKARKTSAMLLKLQEGADKLGELKLRITQLKQLTIVGLIGYIKDEIKKHQTEVIFIDNFQLAWTPLFQEFFPETVDQIYHELKNLAIETKVCVVIGSQISREVEKRGGCKVPLMSDLYGTGTLEEVADMIFFVYRPKVYGLFDERGENLLTFNLQKNIHGRLVEFLFYHNQNFTKIEHFGEVYC